MPGGLTPAYLSDDGFGVPSQDLIASNVTILKKTIVEEAETADLDTGGENRVVRIAAGDNISRILQRMGAPGWLAGAMIESANTVTSMNNVVAGPGSPYPDGALGHPAGQQMEPAGFTLFACRPQSHRDREARRGR